MPNIGDLFPPDNNLNLIKQQLEGLTLANARERLPRITCPICRNVGQYFIFNRGPHLGILCLKCQRENPFRELGFHWLPKGERA